MSRRGRNIDEKQRLGYSWRGMAMMAVQFSAYGLPEPGYYMVFECKATRVRRVVKRPLSLAEVYYWEEVAGQAGVGDDARIGYVRIEDATHDIAYLEYLAGLFAD